MQTRFRPPEPLPPLPDRFGIRGRGQLSRDLGTMLTRFFSLEGYTFNLQSASLLRPELSLPAYAGILPKDGIAPIFNFFDRVGGGQYFRATVTRARMRDFRGGKLTYDEHDGSDFVCTPGTPLVAAAPGVVVAARDTWLRGGLTVCVDHGEGVVTQYTHLSKVVAEIGQPVRRGETVALSGHSGVDMTLFFPWVPPHVHFMVWVEGRPVDPYLAPGEAARPGIWAHGNDPRTTEDPLPGDPSPDSLTRIPVDKKAIDLLLARCLDPAIRSEVQTAPSDAARVAILEDSLHHDRPAWPADIQGTPLRPQGEPSRVKLTLPLPASLYRGARAADMPWTRPAAGN